MKKHKPSKSKKPKQQRNTERRIMPFEPLSIGALENALIGGDLSRLEEKQRVSFYGSVCKSLGLNPLTKPFEYIVLNQKLVLYARKDCTDQLRKLHNISLSILSRDIQEGIYLVTARAVLPNGRADEAIGAVKIDNITGDARANAMMKAETKAKRRVTLSISGLGFFDESEFESMHDIDFPPASNGGDAKRRVETASGNRVETAAASATVTVTDVTESNYKEIESHIGHPNGPLLGKKVGDLAKPILEWLRDNYGKKWAKDVVRPEDERLKKAVEIALTQHATAAPAKAGTASHDAPASTERKGQARKDTSKSTNEKSALMSSLVEQAKAINLTEAQLVQILRNQGIMDVKQSRLSELSFERLKSVQDFWATVKEIAPSFKFATDKPRGDDPWPD